MKFAEIFQNGAVLQRRKPIRVWGTDEQGSTVTVTLGSAVAVVAVADGVWNAVFPPMEAAEGLTMTAVNDLGESAGISDVAVGEVWIAGGQSNMEFLLNCDAERDQVLSCVNEPKLRFFEVPKVSYPGQTLQEDHSYEGFWRKAVPADADMFSAVGFYFARALREYLGDVCVGVIGCNWGGTSASAWMTDSYLDGELEYYVNLRKEAEKSETLEADFSRYRVQQEQAHTPQAREGMTQFLRNELKAPMGDMPDGEQLAYFLRTKYAPFSPFRAGGLYETMLRKIIPYTAAGVIWYQGEEDAARADLYAGLYENMVRCWRDAWGDELPFIQAQLAAFDPGSREDLNFVPIRAVQENITKTVPGVYFVCTMDVGMRYDIHPKFKRPVGERMALQAIAHVYGGNVESECPEIAAASKAAGAVELKLLHSGTGLWMKGSSPEALALTVNGRQEAFELELQGDTMTLRCRAVAQDSRVEVAYAQVPYCAANLYGGSGLPVRPFRVTL